MKLTFKPQYLQLKHPFTIANFTRTQTPVVFTQLAFEGKIGLGEAAMPPYLGETIETATAFLSAIDLSIFKNPMAEQTDILKYIDDFLPQNTAAKASIDMALHDLIGKIINQPTWKTLGSSPNLMPATSCTIGIDSLKMIEQKVKEAQKFAVLKIKLGTDFDKEIIQTIRKITDKPLCIDANQGWKTTDKALKMLEWLRQKNVLFVEQPLPKNDLKQHQMLKNAQILPIFADESCQRLADIDSVAECFDGINIKLMKCTGIAQAKQMILKAKALNLKTLIGCMTESSCAINAAMQLAPQADFCDLDGFFLISNNPFRDPTLNQNGTLALNDLPGIGVKKR